MFIRDGKLISRSACVPQWWLSLFACIIFDGREDKTVGESWSQRSGLNCHRTRLITIYQCIAKLVDRRSIVQLSDGGLDCGCAGQLPADECSSHVVWSQLAKFTKKKASESMASTNRYWHPYKYRTTKCYIPIYFFYFPVRDKYSILQRWYLFCSVPLPFLADIVSFQKD